MLAKVNTFNKLINVNIADIQFNITIENGFENNLGLIDFITYEHVYKNIKLNYFQDNQIKIHGKKIFSEESLSWWVSEFLFEVAIFNNFSNELLAVMHGDRDWHNINIIKTDKISPSVFNTLSEIAFRTIILFHQGIVLHASAVNYQNSGLIFSAPSGIGKSTHANLWVKYRNANIINGDRPAIRVFNNGVRVYGTPWSGTSNQHLNINVPLEAIFMLEQSPINEIKELSMAEALQKITARCYLPYFDEELMELALDNIGTIIQRTPVYLLRCRPDSEAVDVVASCLGL